MSIAGRGAGNDEENRPSAQLSAKTSISNSNHEQQQASSAEAIAPADLQPSSVFEIMMEKHEAIEQTVSLIKKEIAEHVAPPPVATENKIQQSATPRRSDEGPAPSGREFEGLTNLLGDAKVKAIIKSVAGEDTHSIVDEALGAISASSSITDKQQAFKAGIKKLQSNLSQSGKLAGAKNDPTLSLAMSLVGLNREKFR